MRGAVFAIALLAPSLASAADFYVGPSPCSTNTSTCGTNDSSKCCTLRHAIARNNGTAGGNTIVLKADTETVSAPFGTTYHGTEAYAVSTKAVTILPEGSATHTINLNNVLAMGVVFDAGSSGSSISGGSGTLAITNVKEGTSATWGGRCGNVMVSTTNVTVEKLTLTGNDSSLVGEINTVAIRVGADDAAADGAVIRDNTITGEYSFAFYVVGNMQSSASAAGLAIVGNAVTITDQRGDGTRCGMAMFQANGRGASDNTQPIIFANNHFDFSGASECESGVFYRENHAPFYLFNTRMEGMRTSSYGVIYLQDNVRIASTFGIENLKVFNNTAVTTDGGRVTTGVGTSNDWPMCIGSSIGDANKVEFVNNLWSGFATGASLNTGCLDAEVTNTYHERSTNDRYEYNLCHRAGSAPTCYVVNGGSGITNSNNTSTTTSPGLDADLKIGSSSNARAACSNNPIGQGAGTCSVTAAGVTVDCDLDFEGDQRPSGSAWDCGADQFAAEGAAGAKSKGLIAKGVRQK